MTACFIVTKITITFGITPRPTGRKLPGVEGLVEVIAVASYLDEQTAGGEVLIIKAGDTFETVADSLGTFPLNTHSF